MKQSEVEFKHAKVVSESGNELFFDEQGYLIREEPKQETLEEVAENESEYLADYDDKEMYQKGFIEGAKWQQERSYSEAEVLEFTQTMIMQYKFGNTNIEQMDLLKETLQLFKNK